MHPEDRVLVGVMKRQKDFEIARLQHWYRIPFGNAPKGIYAEYIAFFFSNAFGDLNGGIHYYARRTGEELATRAQLLPDEADHKDADAQYHKLQFRELLPKNPPILNQSRRRFSFIYSTWDRFCDAQSIDDLYSREDHLVDRVFHALKDTGYQIVRQWEVEGGYPTQGARLRVLCEDGEVLASVHQENGITIGEDVAESVERIKQEVIAHGGPRMLPTPIE